MGKQMVSGGDVTDPVFPQLCLDPTPGHTMCALTLLIAGGAASDLNRPGLSHLTQQVLWRSKLASLPLELDLKVEAECSYLGVVCLPEHLSRVLSLLGELVEPAALKPDHFEAAKNQVLQRLLHDPERPERRIMQHLRQHVLGPRLGSTAEGQLESLQDLSLQDLLSHHQHSCQMGRLTLAITGPIELNEVREQVQSAFARWPRGEPWAFVQWEPEQRGTLYTAAEADCVGFAFPAPLPSDSRFLQAQLVLQTLLDGGLDDQIPFQWAGGRLHGGFLGVARNVHEPEQLVQELQQRWNQKSRGLDPARFEQARKSMLARRFLRAESVLARSCTLAMSAFLNHQTRSIDEEIQQLRSFALAQINGELQGWDSMGEVLFSVD